MAWRAQFARTRPQSPQTALFRCVRWRWCRACGVGRKRSSLDGHALSWPANRWTLTLGTRRFPPLLDHRLLCLGAGVVECQLDSNLASVFALAVERVPVVALSAAGCDDGVQVGPGLTDQFRLLVVVEYGDLEAVVVGRVVDGETEFLVPIASVSPYRMTLPYCTHHRGVCPPRLSVLVFLASFPNRAAQ
jgi:hypothetical protein